MALTLASVSAQIEITPSGTLNINLVRVAPIGGTISSIAGYRIRLSSVKNNLSILYNLTPALLPTETTVTRQIPLSSISTSLNAEIADLSINIMAIAAIGTGFLDSGWWASDRPFPQPFQISESPTAPAVGDKVTFSLSSTYDVSDISRIRFIPDMTDAVNYSIWSSYKNSFSVEYEFSTAGNIISMLQLSRDEVSPSYGTSYLIRTVALTTPVKVGGWAQTGINSWVGNGGSNEFYFSDPDATTFTPGTFSVIVTGSVISSYNKELKMFLATSRTADANVYYQTVAWDIFPIPGRYKIPSHIPSTTITYDATRAYTDASLYGPLRVTDLSLPNLQIGYSYDLGLEATGGKSPYAFYAKGLPPGMTLTTQGRLLGTPSVSGLFQASISVVDSEVPPQIDIRTLNLYIDTNLTLGDVNAQTYYIGQDVSVTIPVSGGVAPYAWSVLNGGQDLLDYKLALVPSISSSAVIVGTPVDSGLNSLPYNFMTTIQVEDAVGSIVQTTFESSIYPAQLQIAKKYLDEFFDGEIRGQKIYALGGDNSNYSWQLEYLDGPKDINNNVIIPPMIQITPTGLVGSPSTAVISYDPTLESVAGNPHTLVRTSVPAPGVSGDGAPENYYKIRVSVSSGSAGVQESTQQDFDLIISPSLADCVIQNDSELPIVSSGDKTWSIDLTPYVPDPSVASERISPIVYLTDASFPEYLHLTQDGQLYPDSFNDVPPINTLLRVYLMAGETVFFKDFHFVALDVSLGFAITVEDSFQDAGGKQIIAIGAEFGDLCLHSNNSCIKFDIYNTTSLRRMNNTATYVLTSDLPKGLNFASSGVIYGIPAVAGSFDVTINAKIGATSIPYTGTIIINPSSATYTDLLHDAKLYIDRAYNTQILAPVAGYAYEYGTILTGSGSVDNPDSGTETYTYTWDLSSLLQTADLNDPQDIVYHNLSGGAVPTPYRVYGTAINQATTLAHPTIVLLNNTRERKDYSVSFTLTDNLGTNSLVTTTAFTVDPPWFMTASNPPNAMDSLLDGDGTTNTDLLGY